MDRLEPEIVGLACRTGGEADNKIHMGLKKNIIACFRGGRIYAKAAIGRRTAHS